MHSQSPRFKGAFLIAITFLGRLPLQGFTMLSRTRGDEEGE